MSARIPMPHRHVHTRRGSTSHSSTTSSSFSDDEDAITPCPLQSTSQQQQQQPDDEGVPASYEYMDQHHSSQQEQQHHHHLRQQTSTHRQQARRSDSWRNSQVANPAESGPEQAHVDAETLWKRMLAIQRMFGCYNSARMRAALDTGAEGFIPSRTCLDLLNDSIDQLPEESRRQLEEFLEHGGDAPSRRKSWRQRLLTKTALR